MVTTLNEGNVVGGYRVRSLLFHSVAFSAYSAVDASGLPVCLLCADERASRPDDGAFASGLAALKGLQSERLPHVLDGGRDASFSWITTEAIGATEPCWTPGAPPLHWVRVMKVAKEVGEVLAVAAGVGLRHGNLESACIRRFKNGRLCVVGVGVAALFGVDRDTVLNSPRYLAPEQLEDVPYATDDAADIYALGMWMHAALVGREPFEGATTDELPALVRHGSPTSDTLELVPGEIWKLVWMVTRKSRKDRIYAWEHAIATFDWATEDCVQRAREEGRDPKLESVFAELLFEGVGRMSPGEVAKFLREKAAGDAEPEEDQQESGGPESAALGDTDPSEGSLRPPASVPGEYSLPPKAGVDLDTSSRNTLPCTDSEPEATPQQTLLPSVRLVDGPPANDARRPSTIGRRMLAKAAGGAVFLTALGVLLEPRAIQGATIPAAPRRSTAALKPQHGVAWNAGGQVNPALGAWGSVFYGDEPMPFLNRGDL